MTVLVVLLLLAPLVVLALRTTRWDPVRRRSGWTLARLGDGDLLEEPADDDVRRASLDLAAASSHASR